MNYLDEYRRWLTHPAVSEENKAALHAMENDTDAIKMAFSGNLAFGTGGLRGIMSPGTSAMNENTVMHATQGLASYILSCGGEDRGVVIAHDSRNRSEHFARCAASVLAANKITCYLFDGMRPTPVLSFAIRELGCIAGINITASHNAKEYNGYKAYWEDGAQFAPEQADTVSAFIAASDVLEGAKATDFDVACEKGEIKIVGKALDERYFSQVLAQTVNPELLKRNRDMTFVYTPLHGTGARFVPEVLRRAGLDNVLTVPEQMIPDGNFPTVRFPNPEFPEVFAPGIAIAEKAGADLIIATDPDADRVGIMALGGDGKFKALTGNQVGALLLDYIIRALKEKHALPADAYAVKSIVSTELASRICEAEGVTMFNVLTGFKFIGEVIKKHEAMGKGTFLLGFEESYGYLKGTYARDKDAVVAALLIAEMAADYRERGMTLCDALDRLYERYGYSCERLISVTIPGADGPEKMRRLMTSLRETPPQTLGGEAVVSVRDYLSGEIREKGGRTQPTGLPSSDVLYFVTESANTFVVRPSGTEPKVKFYCMTFGKTAEQAEAAALALCSEAKSMTESIG